MSLPAGSPALFADCAVVVILLFFIIRTGKKGLYDCLMPLVIFLISAAGGGIVSTAFQRPVTDRLFPLVKDRFADKIDLGALPVPDISTLSEQLETVLPDSLRAAVRAFGLNVKSFVSDAMEKGTDTVSEIASDAVDALLYKVTSIAVGIALFVLSFVLILLLCILIKKMFGLVMDLPVISWVNRLGGGVLGLIEGVLAVFILARLLCLFGVEFPASWSDGSYLFKAFL